jgi:PPOX class probable FMN-dependent enzyme
METDVRTPDEIREVIPAPKGLVVEKELDHIDAHTRAFIALSPLVIVASADADGRCDASPRGDPPGFVRVLDEKRLLIPDRSGNNRVDTMLNLVSNPRIGLLFLVPGTNETVRVNGRATVVSDEELLAPSEMKGKTPKLGILVEVDEVFFHCARAFIRSSFWKPETWPDRSELPTLGKILRDQVTSLTYSAEELDEGLAEANRNLY